MIRTEDKKLTTILGSLLCAVFLTGCSASTSSEVNVSTTHSATAEGMPPYYYDFDREVVKANVINPCDELPDSFFASLDLDVSTKSIHHKRSQEHPLYLCGFGLDYGAHQRLVQESGFSFGGDKITEETMRENYTMIREEGGWFIANERGADDHTSCTASIATKRGRLSVLRNGWAEDPNSFDFYCEEALRVAKITAEQLYRQGAFD